MRTFLLSAICLLTTGLFPAFAQSNLEKYIINGHEIANFDGSQLEGKIITYYKITTVLEGKDPVRKHVIMTENTDRIISKNDSGKRPIIVSNTDPVIVIDGEKIITKAEFEKIDVETIQSVVVFKDRDNEMVKKYSAEGRGLIMISTKKK